MTRFNYENEILMDAYRLLKLVRGGEKDVMVEFLVESRKMIDEILVELKRARNT